MQSEPSRHASDASTLHSGLHWLIRVPGFCAQAHDQRTSDITWSMLMQAPSTLASYGVKERLRNRWAEAHAGERGGAAFPPLHDGDFAGTRQRMLFALLNSYHDVLLPAYPYPTKCGHAQRALLTAPVWRWSQVLRWTEGCMNASMLAGRL